MSRITNDLDKVSEVSQTGLIWALVSIVTIVGSIIAIFKVNIIMTLVFFGFVLISTLITNFVSKRTLTYASERQQEVGKMNGLVEESYSGRMIIKAFNYKQQSSKKMHEAAAKTAHADFFIRTLPNGYDTLLTNDTENISIGQRQLLTIARVFLCNPAILILDEATSSVDTMTEVEIVKAMNDLMKNRTSFIIAHRLSTIVDADNILLMRDDNIIEQGNHLQLLAQNGAYAQLYNSQFA